MSYKQFSIKGSLVTFIAFLGIITVSYGQRARLFTTDTDLPNSLIFQINQDSKGFIWMATEDGLCRHDGAKITTYKQGSCSILNNYVRLSFEDSKGRLFFGFFNGLEVYDHATDKFTSIPLLLDNSMPFDAHVMSITERKNGDILIGTSGLGIFQLNEDSSVLVANQIVDMTPGNLILQLLEDKKQNLWVSTHDEGLFRLSNNKKIISYSAIPKLGEVSSIVQADFGSIYAGSSKNGLFKYNERLDTFEQIAPDNPIPIVVLIDKKDNDHILIGTDGQGVKYFDPKTNQISNLNFNISNLDLTKSKVHSILEDASGNTWLGLFQKGVALIPAMENNFEYIGHQSVENNLIGSKYVMGVIKEKNGTLWVGTDGDGVYRLEPNSEVVEQYVRSKNYPSSPNTVLNIYQDSHGKIWVGSYTEGLTYFDKTKDQFIKFLDLKDENGREIEHVTSITQDHNNHLWLGTLGSGIFSINLTTNKLRHFNTTTLNPIDNTALHNNWVSSVFVSHNDILYIGTYDGVNYMNLKTESFALYNTIHSELHGKIIYSQYEDRSGRMWFGTSQGLYSFNPKTGKLTTHTMDDGLPSNVICGIKPNGNNLWISTNFGVSEFNIEKGTFVNYYYNDGLQGNEFSKGGAFQDSDGKIYFAGINGITYFAPNEIKGTNREPEIQITGFYINNKPVNTTTRSGDYQVTKTDITNTTNINLSHDDNSFTIEFSSMEFNNPNRIAYIYAMNGNNWENLQPGTNTVTFSNLRPGIYDFKVKAKDYNAFSEIKNLKIEIHPVWYLSNWAKFIYILLLFSIVGGIYFMARQRYESIQKIKEHLQSKKINEAKLEFFINISHEIRTPISLIINPLKKLIKQDSDDKRQLNYFVMHRSAERILKLVNQLLDIRKVDKGQLKMKYRESDIILFLQETCLIFDEQMHGKDIKFSINASQSTKVYIDPNHFDKVIQNILSNAINYTPPQGEINIYVEQIPAKAESENGAVTIEICDTGLGINDQDIERIFDRFYQSTDDKAYNPQGTGIGLHLTKSIVELHHGTIQARQITAYQGTSFIITLPMGKNHLNDNEIDITEDTKPNGTKPRYFIPVPPIVKTKNKIKSKSKLNVLIVDDDDEIRNYLINELAEEYHTSSSMNGEHAYAEILKKSPDIIISDVVMPKMDGITLCKKVKHNVNINHIPVILLTAKTGEEDNLIGLDTGADAYIAKPFNIEILQKTTANLIKNRQLLKNNYNGNQFQSDKIKEIELQSTDDILMQKIMEVINNNIDSQELNVELIASEIGFSRVHLYRKLKEITNQSARDLIKNTRLKQAGDLLTHKQISISEVAYATGFSTPAKFSTSFKEFYGVSPTKFVEKKQKEKISTD